ncbi:EF-hand domain-containing protein [Candidatus Nitrosacidococcus tergens]|uniref:EF-hand domain-containing protein n=1 Tax=Candidatus Nitrosacidococcus tergens TaxID=553981 RepID=A0A7G1Q709_9GAMM|nr:EF-hand domain-containing protein [Candidatus Nitrosacidococcus tergens]CAB1274172.1 protein of unknown function [Candidatus Nitrosacidococcus tergens]
MGKALFRVFGIFLLFAIYLTTIVGTPDRAIATGGLPFPMSPDYIPPDHPKYQEEERKRAVHNLLRLLDRNGDGKVSVEEFEAGTERNFGHLDTDSDGYISKKEMGVTND